MGDNIKVSVRLRNLIEREIQSKSSIYWVAKDKTTVCPVNSNSTSFSYDRVFAGDENNETVYTEFCAPIVESVISGFNGTIFAYGQTSSGKTYTLMGNEKFDCGIAHHTVRDLFEHIQNIANREFLLRVSFMEIYNEKVKDLLAKNSEDSLKLQEDQYGNVKVLNLTESVVQETEQILSLLRKGLRRRKTGETVLNQKSSRSHLIFRMIIESRLRDNENAAVKVSHFNIVDLAGSEKPSENASGARFKEGVNINTSLLMLSQVINQLSAEKESQFINYRGSKLTRILKNSLGGNALTAIICNITPASYDETLSTLKFALNAKQIKNKPQVNEVETEETLIKSYANKIKLLTKQLEATKEEKDQEAKKRKDMQEQIETLKKKFVQFVPQNNITRATRRETWGGYLDMARLNSFQSNRPLKLAVVDEESEMTIDASEFDKKDGYDEDFPKSAKIRTSSISSVTSICDYSKKEDAAVQTDFPQENENVEDCATLEERIAYLTKELSDLKLFTTLEKQMFSDENPDSRVMGKTMNLSSFSPSLKKPRKSSVNLSGDDESFGILNSLINQKSEANCNVIDLDQEMFFQNLGIVIIKLCDILNIEAVSPSIANPYFKVIYQLINIVFQKLFFGSENLIDEQTKKMFSLLIKIFVGFSDQEDLDVQNSELIVQFDEITEKLLKDIEKLFLNTEVSPHESIETKNVNGDIPDIDDLSCSKSTGTNHTSQTVNEKEINSISSSSCQCKSQIPSLEETINNHLETINQLQSNHDLIRKQLVLSEEKIKTQEQVIAGLEKEINLKVKCCVELVDNFTQTSYLTHLNESFAEPRDQTFEPKQVIPGDDYYPRTEDTNSLKCQDHLVEESDQILSVIKNELSDLALFTKNMMEVSMPKAYYEDIILTKPSEALDATSVDSLNAEIVGVKNMLHKIRFYLKDRSEWSESLENNMISKMLEISSLQKQCSSTEATLNEKENKLNKLNADLSQFRQELSERKLSIRAMGVELKCFDLEGITSVDDIAYLKKVVQSFADAVEETHSALRELRQKHALAENKITQTVENYPDLAALEEVRAHEYRERAHLCQENASLKLEVNKFVRKVEDLEEDLKSERNKISEIQKSCEEEIKEKIDRHRELERNQREAMEKCIKDIEDKYEEELKSQEKSLFDMMDEKLKSLREEKNQKLKVLEGHYEAVISELKSKIESLKSELQSKLAEEVNKSYETKHKLEAEIRDYKSREENARIAYYKLKDKFKEYVQSVKNMRMSNAKYVKEKETQTSPENTTTEACNDCRTLKQDLKELKTQTAAKISEMAFLERSNKDLMSKIDDLKKELAAKTSLLLSCNCRLFARPQDLLHKVSHETRIPDAAEKECKQNHLGKNSVDANEVLKLDIVQKAINDAREAERAIFNSGEGPASQEMCILLRRKLAKKEKEISELKNALSRKQIAPIQKSSEKLNSENLPLHPVDAELLQNFTPCGKIGNKENNAALQIHPKKILHEMNKPPEVPRNKWFMTEEEEKKGKELEEKLRLHNKEPDCKQQ